MVDGTCELRCPLDVHTNLANSLISYYAVAGNGDDNTHRLHVLQGGTDANNPMSGSYTYVNSLIPSNFNAWAVDGSILQLDSRLYFIFSGKTTAAQWTQCTYIAPMSSPTALSGPAVQISCPNLSWARLLPCSIFYSKLTEIQEIAATPVQEGPGMEPSYALSRVPHSFNLSIQRPSPSEELHTYVHVLPSQCYPRRASILMLQIVYSASHCSTDDYVSLLIPLCSHVCAFRTVTKLDTLATGHVDPENWG